jgi:hypothetical protein
MCLGANRSTKKRELNNAELKNEKEAIRSVFEESLPVTRHYQVLQKIAELAK